MSAVLLGSALALGGCSAGGGGSAPTPTASDSIVVDVSSDLRTLEATFDADVGVSALDTATGQRVSFREDERFGYASTLKAIAASVMLAEVGETERREIVTWTQDEQSSAGYSPVTEEHVADGLRLDALAEAAVRDSDNLAQNQLIERLGGPDGLDKALAELGDEVTDVVHYEPELNILTPGSTTDTSTPSAFTDLLATIVGSDYLSPSDRDLLIDWMSGNATGDALIRAGAPSEWTVADKSGGAGGIRNDIAVITRPGFDDPIVLTLFTQKRDPAARYEDALVAKVAKTVLRAIA